MSADRAAPIALIDLDGTLADCAAAIRRGLGPAADHVDAETLGTLGAPTSTTAARRQRRVMSEPGFWLDLEPLPQGLQLLQMLSDIGFETCILTKGPRDLPAAWSEKFAWCRRHAPGSKVIITEDKSLVFGHVLVEDWPPYIADWRRRNPHGYVVVPSQPWNADAELEALPHAMRYDGRNLDAVRAFVLGAT